MKDPGRRWGINWPGEGRWRPFTIVILGINALLLYGLVQGVGQTTSELAAGLGFAFNLIIWASIDAILLTVWIITKDDAQRAAKDQERAREQALRSWAKRCAFCDEVVRRNATCCPHCGQNIHPEHLARWSRPPV